jgi:hypothetical protein
MEMMCTGSGIHLYTIGYKYNAKKVLTFIMTANARSTILEKDSYYITKFPDKHGNKCKRKVP